MYYYLYSRVRYHERSLAVCVVVSAIVALTSACVIVFVLVTCWVYRCRSLPGSRVVHNKKTRRMRKVRKRVIIDWRELQEVSHCAVRDESGCTALIE